jgi:hypothetical protein
VALLGMKIPKLHGITIPKLCGMKIPKSSWEENSKAFPISFIE